MMFWKKRIPNWRSDPELQGVAEDSGVNPRAYLVSQGVYRGILGAFVGSMVFFLIWGMCIYGFIPNSLFYIEAFPILGCLSCGSGLFAAAPAAAGGALLGAWLYRDMQRNTHTMMKALLKGILVGFITGLATLVIASIMGMFIPVHNATLTTDNALFIRISPLVFVAAGVGGAFAGWRLNRDIRNGRMYGYF
jgi:hypothetical protein